MEKWIKLFEVGDYQFAVRKEYDEENDRPLLSFVTYKEGIELSYKLGFSTPKARDKQFDSEDKELISTCQNVTKAFEGL